jgi:hypothetical protein
METDVMSALATAPTPDLRIVPVARMYPHEEHDAQRSGPLIEKIRTAEWFINPPVIAPMNAEQTGDETDYVILDGANRHYCFSALGYPHILAQVVRYDSPFVDLDVWNHVISGWKMETFFMQLRGLEGVTVSEAPMISPLAWLAVPDGRQFSFHTRASGVHERNAVLREIVRLYQRQAVLNRTAQKVPTAAFADYPDASGLMLFPRFEPQHVIEAALYMAFLPPGISRHIINGRAVRLIYPMAAVIDTVTPLDEKNATLRLWIERRFANRAVRYYAESTYQFDE